MIGSVSSSGRSRWSRSDREPRRPASANHSPNSAWASTGAAEPRRPAARTRTPRSPRSRPSASRRLGRPGSPRRAPASGTVGRTPIRPDDAEDRRQRPTDITARIDGRRRGRTSAGSDRRSPRPAPARRAWRGSRRSRRGRRRRGLPEVAGAADVEVGPRHGPELAQEQAALDRASPRPSRSSGGRRTSSPSRRRSRRSSGICQ